MVIEQARGDREISRTDQFLTKLSNQHLHLVKQLEALRGEITVELRLIELALERTIAAAQDSCDKTERQTHRSQGHQLKRHRTDLRKTQLRLTRLITQTKRFSEKKITGVAEQTC